MSNQLVEYLTLIMKKVNFSGEVAIGIDSQAPESAAIKVGFFDNKFLNVNYILQPLIIQRALLSIFDIESELLSNHALKIPASQFSKFVFPNFIGDEQKDVGIVKEINRSLCMLDEFDDMIREVFPDITIKEHSFTEASIESNLTKITYRKKLILAKNKVYKGSNPQQVFEQCKILDKANAEEINLSLPGILNLSSFEIHTLREQLFQQAAPLHKLMMLNVKLRSLFDIRTNNVMENMQLNDEQCLSYPVADIPEDTISIAKGILKKLNCKFSFNGYPFFSDTELQVSSVGNFTFEQYNYAYLEAVLQDNITPNVVYRLLQIYGKQLLSLLSNGISSNEIDISLENINKFYISYAKAIDNTKTEKTLVKVFGINRYIGRVISSFDVETNSLELSEEDKFSFAAVFTNHFIRLYSLDDIHASFVSEIQHRCISSQLEYIALIPPAIRPLTAIMSNIAIIGPALAQFIKPSDLENAETFIKAIKGYIATVDKQLREMKNKKLKNESYKNQQKIATLMASCLDNECKNLQAIATLMASCLDNECQFVFGSRSEEFIEVLTELRKVGLKIIQDNVELVEGLEKINSLIQLLDAMEEHPLFALRKTLGLLPTNAVKEIRAYKDYLREKLSNPEEGVVPPAIMTISSGRGGSLLSMHTPEQIRARHHVSAACSTATYLSTAYLSLSALPDNESFSNESKYQELMRNFLQRADAVGEDALIPELILTALDAYTSKKEVKPLLDAVIKKVASKNKIDERLIYAKQITSLLIKATTARVNESMSPLEDLKMTNPKISLLGCLGSILSEDCQLDANVAKLIRTAIERINTQIQTNLVERKNKTIVTSPSSLYATNKAPSAYPTSATIPIPSCATNPGRGWGGG